MIRWISSIYTQPSAQVKVNGVLSQPFSVTNGTRQGCPLSPILFVLSLEPLMCMIQAYPDIGGISIGGMQYKASAYADDMLFSLTNPIVSLPNLLQEIETYSSLSVFKINISKSEAMGVGISSNILGTLKASYTFKWSDQALKYLGTFIPANLSHTYNLNFPPILHRVRVLLERWQRGFHSWFGRCNIIKMNILPKFLYLFQALPIAIPKYYFKQIHSLLVRFIWANKHPRISRALLTIPKQKGGLAVPDMYKYYQAAFLSRLIDWSRHRDGKLWPGLEQAQSSALLQRAAWCYKDLPTITRAHPVIGPTLKIGFELFSKGKLLAIISPLFPILGNPQFEPGLRKGNFTALMEQGIFQASHFLTGEAWPTIFSLTTGSLPYCLDFWRAVQLRHFLNTLILPSSYGCTLTIFEEYCNGSSVFHQTLSKTYALLVAPSEDFRLPFFRGWERDLGRTFMEEQCTNMIHNIFESSICIRMQETNFKILSRWYRTPAFLNRCYPEV